MAIAKSQVEEVYRVISAHIPDLDSQFKLLEDLTKTQAYFHNQSFRNTIEMIFNRARQERIAGNLRKTNDPNNNRY